MAEMKGLTFPTHRQFTSKPDESGSLPAIAIAGIIIGFLALLIVVAAIFYLLVGRSKKSQSAQGVRESTESEKKESERDEPPPAIPPQPMVNAPTYSTPQQHPFYPYYVLTSQPGYFQQQSSQFGAVPSYQPPPSTLAPPDSKLGQPQPSAPSDGSQKMRPFDAEIGQKMVKVQKSQTASKTPVKSPVEPTPKSKVAAPIPVKPVQSPKKSMAMTAPDQRKDVGKLPKMPTKVAQSVQPKEFPKKPAGLNDNVAKVVVTRQF